MRIGLREAPAEAPADGPILGRGEEIVKQVKSRMELCGEWTMFSLKTDSLPFI